MQLDTHLSWSELTKLINNTLVYGQHTETSNVYMKNCRYATYLHETIVTGPFGTLIQIAPDTFSKKYPSKEVLLKDLSAFNKIREWGIKNSAILQIPAMILWYFTFNGNDWYLSFNFQYTMQGESNAHLHKWGIVNPQEYLFELSDASHIMSNVMKKTKGLLTVGVSPIEKFP